MRRNYNEDRIIAQIDRDLKKKRARKRAEDAMNGRLAVLNPTMEAAATGDTALATAMRILSGGSPDASARSGSPDTDQPGRRSVGLDQPGPDVFTVPFTEDTERADGKTNQAAGGH